MVVGFYQFNPVFGDVSKNLDKIENALSKASFDLIVLPELCTTGYQFISEQEVRNLAEPIPGGPTCRRLIHIARKSDAYIIAGLAEKDNTALYNTAVLVGKEGIINVYRKIHLFCEETIWFTPGSDIPVVSNVKDAKVGIIICFDWLFPEIFRILALAGADIIAQPANLVLPYCQSAMQTRSIENHIFTVTANRIGREARGGKNPLVFTGKSQISDVNGDILISASAEEETIKVIEIEPERARDKMITPYNSVLGSRRPEIYAEALCKDNIMGD